MSGALYAMYYVGGTGVGSGAIHVGNGKIVGIDVGNIRFHGTYTEQEGRLRGTVKMSAPNGATLVTGAQLPAGTQLNLTLDWPSNFADGTPKAILVEGRPVHVTLEKIGDT